MINKINAYYETQDRTFAKMEQKMLIESLTAIEANEQLREIVVAGESVELSEFCQTLSFYPDLSGFCYTWLIRNLQFILNDGADAFIDSMSKYD
jgi:hypothetical protein